MKIPAPKGYGRILCIWFVLLYPMYILVLDFVKQVFPLNIQRACDIYHSTVHQNLKCVLICNIMYCHSFTVNWTSVAINTRCPDIAFQR
jgi:hypothetical protein